MDVSAWWPLVAHHGEPHLEGPCDAVGSMHLPPRRLTAGGHSCLAEGQAPCGAVGGGPEGMMALEPDCIGSNLVDEDWQGCRFARGTVAWAIWGRA